MGPYGACVNRILRHRNQIMAILISVLLMPLPFVVDNDKAKCGYVFLLMTLFWITEVVPLGITAYITFMLFPMFGILPGSEVAANFYRELTMAHMGAFMIITGMERSHLSKRIALNMLLGLGCKPQALLCLLMVLTFVLSMWCPNLAVSAMVVHVAQEIVHLMKQATEDALKETSSALANGTTFGKKQRNDSMLFDYSHTNKGISLVSIDVLDTGNPHPPQEFEEIEIPELEMFEDSKVNPDADLAPPVTDPDPNPEKPPLEPVVDAKDEKSPEKDNIDSQDPPNQNQTVEERWFHNLFLFFGIGITFASKLGGVASIRGDLNNIVAQDMAEDVWYSRGVSVSPIDFTTWLVVSLPIQIIALVFIWIWVCLHYLKWGGCSMPASSKKFGDVFIPREFLEVEKRRLGHVRYYEWMVCLLIVSMLLLYLFVTPQVMTGYSARFSPGFVTITVPGSMIVIAMMIIPSKLSTSTKNYTTPVPPLGNMRMMVKIFPWSVLLVVGGCNALAEGMKVTGVVDWAVDGMAERMSSMSGPMLVFVLSLTASFFTELTTSTLPITFLVPLATVLAEGLGKNPLYLILPVSISSAYSFLLPIGGTTNGWLVTSGKATQNDYLKVGFVPKLLCLLLVMLGVETWGDAFCDFDVMPYSLVNGTIANTTTVSAADVMFLS